MTTTPRPEDIERAEELMFQAFQIPAAMWSGVTSAFSQLMPLTTKTFSNAFLLTRIYVMLGIVIYVFLVGDALIKAIRMYRLMMLGRLKPWKCVCRLVGFGEILQSDAALGEEAHRIRVPLTGFAAQIITMSFLDLTLSIFLAVFWIMWLPFVLFIMVISCVQPKPYYDHIRPGRGRYARAAQGEGE